MPEFSKRDNFSPNLYENLYALDIQDLGFRFRLLQWGRTSEKGPTEHVRMVYTSPEYENPVSGIELNQIDTASSNRWQYDCLSDEGRKETLLRYHQNLFAPDNRDQSFHHMNKQTVTLDAIPGTLAVLDSWRSPKRSYWILQDFLNEVELLVVQSGLDGEEADDILRRLVPIAGNEQLAEWHDNENRSYAESLWTMYSGN